MSDNDHLFDGFLGYIAEACINAEVPIPKYSLSKSFKDLCNLTINDRFFCNQFDPRVVDRVLKSKYDIELKARIFFITSTPVPWPDFLNELHKVADIQQDTRFRLTKYVSKIDGVTKFQGEHRKCYARRRTAPKSGAVVEDNRDDSEVFNVEEEVEDPEFIEPPMIPQPQPVPQPVPQARIPPPRPQQVIEPPRMPQPPQLRVVPHPQQVIEPPRIPQPQQLPQQRVLPPHPQQILEPPRIPQLMHQPPFQMPHPQFMNQWMRMPGGHQFIGPNGQVYYETPRGAVIPESSTPEEDEGRAGRQIQNQNPMNQNQNQMPEPSTSNMMKEPMEPSPKKMKISEIQKPNLEEKEKKVEDLIILESPVSKNQSINSNNETKTSFMDSTSFAPTNYYAKFLREIYFFHGEVSGSFDREIKELVSNVENQNQGMNITPSKIKSHLEVCLDEICFNKMTKSNDILNLKTMLKDLDQMGRHLVDDLSIKVVPLVSTYSEDIKETDTVSKKGAKEAIESMIDRLKKCAK